MNSSSFVCKALLLSGSFFVCSFLAFFNQPAHSQVVENTDNQSTGSSTTFQIRINSTHGVSTSITKTKDTDASASGSLIVGPNSTSIQENKDGASGFMQQGGGTGLGQTSGVSGFQRINFGEGTRYDASVRSLTSDEFCAGSSSCSLPEMGNASASATGNTSTVISVESTESSFINSFVRSFEAQ